MLTSNTYHLPKTLEEALTLWSDAADESLIISGATDIFPAARDGRKGDVFIPELIDITKIKELDGYIEYELPSHLLGVIWKGKYKGQKQKWFCMKFIGKDNEINIKTKKPEFSEWKWVDIDEITNYVVDFKTEVYKNLKLEVKNIIIN